MRLHNIIIICIFICACFLMYIVLFDGDNDNDGFEVAKCDSTVDICTNSDDCCLAPNNAYLCSHPLVRQCNAEVNRCASDQTFDGLYPLELKTQKCKLQKTGCCTPFDTIAVNDKLFRKIEHKTTMNTKGMGSYLSLDYDAVGKLCPKLCQTDGACAGYKINRSGCQFYSEITPPKLGTFKDDTSKTPDGLYIKN